MLVVNTVIGKIGELYNRQSLMLYVLCLVMQALLCIFIMFMQYFLSERLRIVHEREIVEQMLSRQKDHYRLSNANALLLNTKLHDIKYQLAALAVAPPSDGAAFSEMRAAIAEYDSLVKSDNHVLNVILSEKGLYCEKHHIRLSYVADPHALDFMPPSDIYSLVGNALDNCIEAVMRCTDKEKRVISLTVSAKNGFVNIQTNNYYEGKIEIEDGLPGTTKAEKDMHGFGVRSIRYIAERYDGVMQFSTKNNIFILQVSIPLPRPHTES
jgi:hypothetical protein